ncbi:MAG: hypothetical protein KGD57_01340 [Candidatus Lokiarchaeota archaeon]|nr:hypothetical protein [Candidatus Lokiarchaeota archaeon]
MNNDNLIFKTLFDEKNFIFNQQDLVDYFLKNWQTNFVIILIIILIIIILIVIIIYYIKNFDVEGNYKSNKWIKYNPTNLKFENPYKNQIVPNQKYINLSEQQNQDIISSNIHNYCQYCGGKLEKNMIFCPECGNNIKKTDKN